MNTSSAEAGPSRSRSNSRSSSTASSRQSASQRSLSHSASSERSISERGDDTDVAGGQRAIEDANGGHQRPDQTHPSVSGRSFSGESYDDNSDEEEEEEEPVLKYSRLKGKLPEVLAKDHVSAIAIGSRFIALGTQIGMVHVLSYEGAKISSYRAHSAIVTSIRLEDDDIVATASFEGRVVIKSLTTPETHAFDYNRPLHSIALEPDYSKKASRAFVCGGLAGNLVLQEKGWLGFKQQVIHSGEGPIWAIEWRGTLIAWANDLGVKIYDTVSGQRIGYVDRGVNAPRAELFKCNLVWRDDKTLVIAWGEHIKVVRVRSRTRSQIDSGLPNLTIEMTGIFQIDCMISGIALYGSTYVVLAYVAPDSYDNEATDDHEAQRRKAANRPEIRLIDKGEETMADALSLTNYHSYGCNSYMLAKSGRPDDNLFLVVSPAEIIQVRPRDEADHIAWLVDHERFEEALSAAEAMQAVHGSALDVKAIGAKYMHHLVEKGEHERAAELAPKVFALDVDAWTACIHMFLNHGQLKAILPKVPITAPQLDNGTYEVILDRLLGEDKEAMVRTLRTWPGHVYDNNVVMGNIQGELESTPDDPLLLEGMGELLLAQKQPGKALPFFLRLKQTRVFDLIREYNLFMAIQDQVVLLVDLDDTDGTAVQLLVDHMHSIPIARVVRQLEERPKYLFYYLQALFHRDPQLCFAYSDRMISLSAQYDPNQLLPFLRASNSYDLEHAYKTCEEHDYVPEMVFLLGRMGNNKQALMLIIERLGDVQRAIDFASEQADDDLWEDLLQYSESRPTFIRALLEHVGAEINPIRLISRIKNGMEIPGLQSALIKIVQASNLQVQLSEDCYRILNGDCSGLAERLQGRQTYGAQASPKSTCAVCGLALFADMSLMYLCRHLVHATCALSNDDLELPERGESLSVSYLLSGDRVRTRRRELGNKLSHAAAVRTRVGRCPVCVVSRGSLTC